MLLSDIKEGIISFKYFKFDIEIYSFFRRFQVVGDKKIRQKLVVCMFYLTVHCFLARVQSPRWKVDVNMNISENFCWKV